MPAYSYEFDEYDRVDSATFDSRRHVRTYLVSGRQVYSHQPPDQAAKRSTHPLRLAVHICSTDPHRDNLDLPMVRMEFGNQRSTVLKLHESDVEAMIDTLDPKSRTPEWTATVDGHYLEATDEGTKFASKGTPLSLQTENHGGSPLARLRVGTSRTEGATAELVGYQVTDLYQLLDTAVSANRDDLSRVPVVDYLVRPDGTTMRFRSN